ncbi:hypothetical protein N7520_009911 [Penicillium odoratum]|uniref:uncharacterized protein n=1 Tax=Penicillium odoratum TaxID=1167516 RepID=UPI002546B1C4|nr:uncharacterized protein N7520_009911 [Penicillium odoratum]KAJ5752994.1 hypothetical protein N7520_009911 [Penicillium odoratum]
MVSVKRSASSPLEGDQPPAKKSATESATKPAAELAPFLAAPPATPVVPPAALPTAGIPGAELVAAVAAAVAAAAAGPAAGGPACGPWVFKTMNDVPLAIRAKHIIRYSVKFLYLGMAADGILQNHTIVRLTFQHEQTKDTTNARAETKGYEGRHNSAQYDFDIPIKAGRTKATKLEKVKDFLQVIHDNETIPVGFNTDEHTVGCKDFNTQLIHRLIQAKILDVPDEDAGEYYENVLWNYGLGDLKAPNKIGYAIFNPTYYENHFEIPELAYEEEEELELLEVDDSEDCKSKYLKEHLQV